MAEFNPYQQYSPHTKVSDVEKSGTPQTPYTTQELPLRSQASSAEEPPSNNLYWRISRSFGFRERYSLAFFFVCGGALLGYCLSRFEMFSPHNVQHRTNPGEWFWYRKKLYKPNIFIHIYTTTFAGILSGTQFIPAIRRQYMTLHRMNGYLVILLLLMGMVTGGIVARHSMGGDVNTQSAFYTLAFMISFSVLCGISNVRNTPVHRKWMLRTVAYLGSVVTGRIIKHIAMEIISSIGTFYSIWTCKELEFTFGDNQSAYRQQFPECAASALNTVIRASTSGTNLEKGSAVRCTFGMSLWIGLLIHAIAVELYISFSR